VRRAVARLVAVLACGAPMLPAIAADELRNWFNDPFFAISAALPDCPLPAGPFVDEADKLVQSHRRAEKGTTCWLAKECDRPNAYVYDPDIAAEIQAAVRERQPFPGTSLWVTVQGRVVYIEGCAGPSFDATAAEAFVRALPHVQQAISIVRTDPSQKTPYKRRVPE
jgi:hypothetical protein